ncbi:hypothetical protein ACFVP0_06280 [Streptomyces cinereoruber]|uniref:hypothetical protein n=1 Tax=Streptomyces cinereoruber TaxID=67260 RepID=UPI0036CBD31A
MPFKPGAVERPHVQCVLLDTLVWASEERRRGDLRLELKVRAVPPRASVHPGRANAQLRLDTAKGHWQRQLEGLGRSLGGERRATFSTATNGEKWWLRVSRAPSCTG